MSNQSETVNNILDYILQLLKNPYNRILTHSRRDCPCTSSFASNTLRPDINCSNMIPNAYTSVLTERIPFSAYSGATYLLSQTNS